MINERCAKSYCSEDISLIENYHKAIADKEKMWEIHHRRECDENGRTLFTRKQLKEINLYYKRPASELIFVTRPTHKKIHREMCGKRGKKNAIPIIQFAKDGKFLKEWRSLAEAERKLRIAHSSICWCCKGKSKSAGGFIWKYKS